MSALGQKQTYAVQNRMSALPPKAHMCSAQAHVCFGPEADSCSAAKNSLFDHFAGAGEERGWHREAERFGSPEIDNELEFNWLHNRQLSWSLTL